MLVVELCELRCERMGELTIVIRHPFAVGQKIVEFGEFLGNVCSQQCGEASAFLGAPLPSLLLHDCDALHAIDYLQCVLLIRGSCTDAEHHVPDAVDETMDDGNFPSVFKRLSHPFSQVCGRLDDLSPEETRELREELPAQVGGVRQVTLVIGGER